MKRDQKKTPPHDEEVPLLPLSYVGCDVVVVVVVVVMMTTGVVVVVVASGISYDYGCVVLFGDWLCMVI